MARSAERVRQRGDSLPTNFVSNKTRAKQRRTKEPVKMQVLEQGSGEPRALPSPLVELVSNDRVVCHLSFLRGEIMRESC